MRTITCPDLKCGIEFSVPEHVYIQARWNPARWITCPNGHNQHYEKSLKEECDEKISSLEHQVVDLNERLARQVKLVSYWRGQAHRERKT